MWSVILLWFQCILVPKCFLQLDKFVPASAKLKIVTFFLLLFSFLGFSASCVSFLFPMHLLIYSTNYMSMNTFYLTSNSLQIWNDKMIGLHPTIIYWFVCGQVFRELFCPSSKRIQFNQLSIFILQRMSVVPYLCSLRLVQAHHCIDSCWWKSAKQYIGLGSWHGNPKHHNPYRTRFLDLYTMCTNSYPQVVKYMSVLNGNESGPCHSLILYQYKYNFTILVRSKVGDCYFYHHGFSP